MNGREVGATLRSVSALRALCQSLPHLPTPGELDRMERFATLVVSPGLAGVEDVEAVLAGWRQWWRDGRTGDLLAMARALGPTLVEHDRRLASYALAARESCRPQ